MDEAAHGEAWRMTEGRSNLTEGDRFDCEENHSGESFAPVVNSGYRGAGLSATRSRRARCYRGHHAWYLYTAASTARSPNGETSGVPVLHSVADDADLCESGRAQVACSWCSALVGSADENNRVTFQSSQFSYLAFDLAD
jgi:hypothetical protein